MKKTNRAGYTIVELMIVLAVTGATAVGAFALVQGQQGKNEFAQAVRDFETRLNDIANDVAKGYYPNLGGNQPCTAALGMDLSFSAGAPVEQGSSTDCVFAGKALQFNIGAGDDSKMQLLTIAARRLDRVNGKTVTSFASLQDGDIEVVPGIDEDVPLYYGLRAKSVTYNGADGNNAIVFLSGFGNRPTVTSGLSGAPSTDLYWVPESNPVTCNLTLKAALERKACYVAPAAGSQGIEICMEHGEDGRNVLFTIGNSGRQLSTTTEIREIGNPC